MHLQKYKDKKVEGRKKLGVEAFAQALLAIPRILANNAGHDQQELLLKLLDGTKGGKRVGLDLANDGLIDPMEAGILDNYCVKKQFIHLGYVFVCIHILFFIVQGCDKNLLVSLIVWLFDCFIVFIFEIGQSLPKNYFW